MLTAAVAACAVLAGLAGAWSPCGFSMVDTLAPSGYAGRRRTSLISSAAFAAGALAGGVATFGGLALLGDALGLGGAVAVAVAVAALIAAAAGDAAGRRIVPQVRRQVPESWRRVLPVPVAGGLYGVLLGLGFTTFVLSFASYGLAAVCLALGDVTTGLVAGVAFGVGRAVPVVALAPLQERDGAAAVAAAMAERPAVLRGLRAAAAAAVAAVAASLAFGAAPASAADLFRSSSTDPSGATDGLLAWQNGSGRGLLLRRGQIVPLPGRDPAVAPGLVAWAEPERVVVARSETLEPLRTFPATDPVDLAVSDRYVAWRERLGGGSSRLATAAWPDPAAPVRFLASGTRAAPLGRPVLDGTRVVFTISGRTASRIVEIDLANDFLQILRRSTSGLLLGPTLRGEELLYVQSTFRRQELRLGPRVGDGTTDRILWSRFPTARRDVGREPGKRRHAAGYPGRRAPSLPPRPPRGVTISWWTTAMNGTSAYVTSLRHRPGGVTEPSIWRVAL